VAAKTLNEFYKQWREPTSGGFIRLFKDIRDQDVWEAATKAAEEKFSAANKQSEEIPGTICYQCRVCGEHFDDLGIAELHAVGCQ
jgi:hypothetical protein